MGEKQSAAPRHVMSSMLNDARHRKGLSIRAAARLADVPSATMQGWLNGRHLPTPALRPNFERLLDALEVSVPDEYWTDGKRTDRPRAPYLGLRPFGVNDAALFHGRQAEARRLADLILELPSQRGLIVLMGASGSGKSSLLAAGLVARECTDGALAGWRAEVTAYDRIGSISPDTDLIVVDQFEDLFFEDNIRVEEVLSEVQDLAHRRAVVLGLRSDAFADAALHAALRPALEKSMVLAEMTVSEWTQAIVGPAETVGVTVSPELVSLLLQDLYPVEGTPVPTHTLPLLSNALLATWQQADGVDLQVSHYIRTGGLAAALNNLAEQVYDSLSTPEQALVQDLFLRLLRVTGGHLHRMVIPIESLRPDLLKVATHFIAARLMTTLDDCIMISHDALLTQWERLSAAIEAGRTELEMRERLREATSLWLAHDKSPDSLIPVSRLPQLADLVTREEVLETLSDDEQEFLSRSAEHFESQLDKERRSSRSLRRHRRIAVSLAVLAMVAALLAGNASLQGQRISAEAQSRQMAYQVRSLNIEDPNLEAFMSVVGVELADTAEARSALSESLAHDMPVRWAGTGPAVLAVAPEGNTVVRLGGLGEVTTWSSGDLLEGPGRTWTVSSGGPQLYSGTIGRLGSDEILAVGGEGHLSLWRINEQPELVANIDVAGTTIHTLTLSDSGILAAGDSDGTVWFFRLEADGALEEAGEVTIGEPISGVAFDPERSRVYVSGAANSIHQWDLATGTPTELPPITYRVRDRDLRAQTMALSPDGRWLIVGLAGRASLRWDLTATESAPVMNESYDSWVNSVRFIDNSTYITTDSGQAVQVFDATTDTLLRSMKGPAIFTDAAIVADMPVAVDIAGALRAWAPQSPVLRLPSNPIYQLASDGAGEAWLASSDIATGQVQLWSLSHEIEPLADAPIPPNVTLSSALQMSNNGSQLWAGTADGQVVSWPIDARGAQAPTLHRVLDDTSWIGFLAVNRSGDLLAATEYTGKKTQLVTVSDDGTLTPLITLDTPMPQMPSFSRDGSLLALGVGGNEVRLWSVVDPAKPELVSTIAVDSEPLTSLFSPTTDVLAIGTNSGNVSLWDLTDPAAPAQQRSFDDARSSIMSMTFSPDGSRLVATGADETFFAWRLDDRDSVDAELAIIAQVGQTLDAKIIQNGQLLVGSGMTGQIQVWPLDTSTARATVCERRGTPLTDDEWARFMTGIKRFDPCSG